MAIKVFSGVLKELGTSAQEASKGMVSSRYSYIEFTDGQVMRNVVVIGGLTGKIQSALEDRGVIELHVMQGAKKGDFLVAVRLSDGKTYAVEFGSGLAIQYVILIAVSILGIILTPFFGIGLPLLWGAWLSWRGIQFMTSARKHVNGLSNAILI